MVHGMREKWEECSKQRPDEGVHRDGAVGIEAIAVDQIAHALPKRYHTTKTNERS